MNTFYLEENTLKVFLEERFSYKITSPRLKLPEGLVLPDFLIEDLNLILEYDGPRHYTQSSTAIRDIKKAGIYKNNNYDTITIPFFVQLDEPVIDDLFKNYTQHMRSVDTFNTYPHGFISDKVILPSDFCSLGVRRFVNELEGSFNYIKPAIIDSLENKINKKRKREEVYPISMIEFPDI